MFKKRSAQGNARKRDKVESDGRGFIDKRRSKRAVLPLNNQAVNTVANTVVNRVASTIGNSPVVADGEGQLKAGEKFDGKEHADQDQKRLEKIRLEATKEDRLNSEAKDSVKKIKQASHLRNTLLMDFQPDVCKDFKQTGYCGYGDSCKFLHSRDDFKAGWKLNQEWKLDEIGKPNEPETDIPFKCAICKNDYKTPVRTNCNHYFCRKCFVDRNKIEKTCFVCGKETGGIAKVATNLQIPE